MRRLVGLVLAALTAGAVLWLWPRHPKDPEAQIRELVAECVAGVEKRELSPISDALADDFRGPQQATAQDLKRIVAAQILRDRETVAVFNPSLDVNVHGNDTADLSGVFLFARSKELKPETVAAAYRIDVGLERRGGDWKFVSASYERTSWP